MKAASSSPASLSSSFNWKKTFSKDCRWWSTFSHLDKENAEGVYDAEDDAVDKKRANHYKPCLKKYSTVEWVSQSGFLTEEIPSKGFFFSNPCLTWQHLSGGWLLFFREEEVGGWVNVLLGAFLVILSFLFSFYLWNSPGNPHREDQWPERNFCPFFVLPHSSFLDISRFS